LLAACHGRRVRVAAAADYWFSRGWRARICRAAVGAFAVRRDGGGSADLAAMTEFLRSGGVVLIFPEGTRSRDGVIGPFHRGALRLAAAADVPVVPVGINGTARLLPVHGTPWFATVGVRIGEPTTPSLGEDVRSTVVQLASVRPVADARSRRRLAAFATSRLGLLAVAVWSFAEAFSWPFVPELLVAVLVLAAPRAVVRLVPVAVAASVLGCVTAYAAAGAGMHFPAPLTTPRMHTVVVEQTAAQGADAVRAQPLSGIPVKVYAEAAGEASVPVAPYALNVLAGRGLRIALIGAGAALVGAVLSLRRRFYPAVVLPSLGAFGAGLAQVVATWS
jgi:membrane protein YqaA with SNARE-associated domain